MARKISDATVRLLDLYRDEIGLKLPIGGGSDCGGPFEILHSSHPWKHLCRWIRMKDWMSISSCWRTSLTLSMSSISMRGKYRYLQSEPSPDGFREILTFTDFD